MLGTKTIEDMIMRGDFPSIKEVMEKSENLGMQTFDAAMFNLYREGRITLDDALKNADSANNLRLRIKLAENGGSMANEEKIGTDGKPMMEFSLMEDKALEDGDENF
jgi:twitching motility protein PilU